MKGTRLDRRLAIALLAVVIVLSLLLQTLDTTSKEQVEGSVASTAGDGRRALFSMLSELGFTVRPWRQLPGTLPRGDHLLWLARAPEPWSSDEAPSEEEEEEADPGEDEEAADSASVDTTPSGLVLHALGHYRRFLEENGTMVLPATEHTLAFLTDILGLEAARDLALLKAAPAGAYRVRTSSGEELDIECDAGSVFTDLDPRGPARELWFAASVGSGNAAPSDLTERPIAIVLPVASGRVVLLGEDRFLDNARIGERDHALFAVRLLEELDPRGRILFDEYALGLWEQETAFGLATSTRLGLATLQLLLVLGLFVWRTGWARAFPRDPEAHARISPLARARSLAGLLVRARRWDLLADDLRRAALARLRARARLRPVPGHAAGAQESAEHELARIAARVGRTDDLARWREATAERRIDDAAGFERLALDLAQIERS